MNSGIKSWWVLVVFAFNAFSIPLLLKTLLSPWRMDSTKGSNFGFLEKFVFAIFSRALGLIARLLFIALGLLFTILVILTFPIFVIFPIKISREFLRDSGSMGAFLSYGDTYTLNQHSKDLVTKSSEKFIGREKALRIIERGLAKDKNRNALIVGDTGVGKSTLVKYLGRLGQSGLSFEGIRGHRVVELFVENITIEDFEKSLKEAAFSGNVILVIENIHAFEALFERIAPYLQKRHLGIIATTDFSNYDQVLKNHPEFLSKFEKVDLLPTSFEETFAILKNKCHVYGVSIKEDGIKEIITLADRFIGNQPQPLKSVLILEELRALKRKITIDDVRQIVSDKTNIPIGSLGADERKVLMELGVNMRRKIIGQDEAVKDVSEALKRLRTGISDPNKPAGSFLFLGPSGAGKTYTAKILAESYFGRKNAMIRFDMSEFSLPESVSAFSERLTAIIEEAPLSLVFFDELEKASHMIHNLLLQVLDEGRLTRENGRVASFKDAIIITTSNAGSKNIIENPKIDKKTLVDNLIRDNIFAPEFLNRFSSIILFRPLNKDEIKKVTGLLLEEFKERLLIDKSITLEITDALIEKIASAGFDPQFGARPIKRAIEEIVENQVADFIMKGGGPGGVVKII